MESTDIDTEFEFSMAEVMANLINLNEAVHVNE
jgi:hypothetical protein